VGKEQNLNRIFCFGALLKTCLWREKTGFLRRGTSIAGKAFVEREYDEVGMRYLLGRCCKDIYLLETPLYKGILNYSGIYRRFFEKLQLYTNEWHRFLKNTHGVFRKTP
jgi:hypothetical protein